MTNPFYAEAKSPKLLAVRVRGKIFYDAEEFEKAQQLAREGRFEEANYHLRGAVSFKNETEFDAQFWSDNDGSENR